jgi:hypothetical protein
MNSVDQWPTESTPCPTQSRVRSRIRLNPSWDRAARAHDRADTPRSNYRPRACLEPTWISHFPWSLSHSTIWFCYNELNHFTSLNSSILLYWTQPFYLTKFSHFCYIAQLFYDFATMNSVILWSCQPFPYTELIHFATVLSHFVILSTIFFLHWTQQFFATVLNHSSLIQCSVIFRLL